MKMIANDKFLLSFLKDNLLIWKCINIKAFVLIAIIMEEFYRRKYLSPTYSRSNYTESLEKDKTVAELRK
jgi:hypothetical protein